MNSLGVSTKVLCYWFFYLVSPWSQPFSKVVGKQAHNLFGQKVLVVDVVFSTGGCTPGEFPLVMSTLFEFFGTAHKPV